MGPSDGPVLQGSDPLRLLGWGFINTIEQSNEGRLDLPHERVIQRGLPRDVAIIGMDRAVAELLEHGQVPLI